MHFRHIIPLVFIFWGLYGCITVLYVPTENDATNHNVSLNTLKKGRELYMNKCSSCHNLYLPTKYTNQKWLLIIGKMQKRAKIDSSQKDLIMKYICICTK
jgi:hypothetical protein